ncbi:unnamed protein product [Urochloa decumbens]|uniref:TCP domain-containing protein n=1 Tax=Urochloa decumbens TaxID=240449 RepID=A0ABC9BS03_9POAL
MPATAMSSSAWDAYGGGQQIFPADMVLRHQDTLEAVLHQQPAAAAAPTMLGPPPDQAAAVDGAAAPRRRAFRTDRHSKIRTAQGVRDRRMRLSVGVAREFFALQDRLGFDKASKTVNWLLTQSKPAIDRLHGGADEPPAAAAVAVKGRVGEGSSSTTASSCCFKDPEKATSRGGGDGPAAAAALVEEHAGGEIDWIMPDAATAPPQSMNELEYCYQYYLQLEEMMRCNNGGVPR